MENLKTNNENIFEANNFLAEENHLSYNIERIHDLFQNPDKKMLIECCKNLNNIFAEELEKKGIDFFAALNSKVENPIA
ncbi:hypothetical protein D8B46_06325 [Candidatus Gracilibacteria bacterium]|nr:MAG: hypothetical protein D8B46_06325 [Candidatus Gracilibacteria bacterium]